MGNETLPKVLAVSLSTWRSDSGIHTQTDLFKFWDPERLAQIYTKSDLPDTPVCHTFFQISENAIIRSVLTRKPVGRRVENGAHADERTQRAAEAERELYEKAHRKKSWLMTLLREAVWAFGKWKTKALLSFIDDFSPDVFFMPVYPVIYMGWLQLYILKKYPKPYVCYLADDNYSYMACGKNPLAYIHRFFLRGVVRKLSTGCREMFTITKTEAQDTDRLFSTQSVVLTKGIDYSGLSFSEKEVSEPIKMVYTGKLVIGRASSLVLISEALAAINADKLRVTLDIYSPDVLDGATMKKLNDNGCTFKGVVPREQIAAIQESADITVFVESLEKRYINAARLSFSTKLTDYFSSGKCILAIGDAHIAPIAYLRENDAAIIAESAGEIKSQLMRLVNDPALIRAYGRKAFECGKRNHDESKVKETFISTIRRAASPSGE